MNKFLLPISHGWFLTYLGKRVPKNNELYIAKNGKIIRQKGNPTSNNAQARNIVKEGWLD